MSIKNVKQSPSYDFLTKRAADCIISSIDRMVEKLSKMEHVEYMEKCGEFDEDITCKLNLDSGFITQLHDMVTDEFADALRKYS